MLANYEDRASFAARLNEMVSASQPIQTIEHLHGRTNELDQIEKALFAPGRHVFIYGDRGVGKSSLAAAAAAQYQSSDAHYIDVGCGPDATLNTVIANIALQSIASSRLTTRTEERTAGITWRFLNLERKVEEVSRDLHAEIKTVLDAVEVLREVAAMHSAKPIVVMDEFDRIRNPDDRHLFADLVKHLGDKKVPLKFIFTGGRGIARRTLRGSPVRNSAVCDHTSRAPKLGWSVGYRDRGHGCFQSHNSSRYLCPNRGSE